MSTKAIGSGLLVILLLAACGSTTSSPTPSASPSPSPLGGQGGPGGGGAGGGGSGGGGPDGVIQVKWSERVTRSGGGVSSVITQTYTAVVAVTLTDADTGAWTITGTAVITGTFTSDYESHTTTPLGPCNVHYTDDASAGGKVDIVDGGLEARDGSYQFYVNIPGLDGSNDTVRDDSGCNGPNNHETTVWSIAPTTENGSGEFTDAGHISGSHSEPREGGEDTVSWDFTPRS